MSEDYLWEAGESLDDLIELADRKRPDKDDGWNRIVSIRDNGNDVAYRQSGTWKIVPTTK